jgi:sugar-specific transcriptional regulator TrmB
MEISSDTSKSSSALRALGLSSTEDRIYRSLLISDGMTASDISTHLHLALQSSQRVLNALEKNGLVTHSPEQTTRYSAVPPDFAAEVLIARRQTELHHARTDMAKLRDSLESERKGRRPEERLVEILPPRTAGLMFSQLLHGVQTEILCLERLPGLVSATDKPDDRYLERVARGVRCRSVTDSQLFNMPGTLNRLSIATAAGEQFRIFPSLPFKLVVFDRRVAIIPLHLVDPDGPVLLVRSSSLLDALCETFEMYWHAAAPFIASHEAVASEDAHDCLPVLADALLSLLASGMNDKSIERELDVSTRTLGRRIGELTKRLGASTRFQAGWLAAQAMHEQRSPAEHD